jgi:phenylacetate-CoA ligase
MSSGNTEKQLMMMKDLGVTVLICTPSYALYIAETAEKLGIDPGRDLKLRVGLFGAEASSEAMRQETQKKLGLLATENYGLSEVIGPGVSGECVCQCGMHINEDHFIPEIVDPDTGRVLPIGEKGELVLTAVTKEALPILRYRTKDLTRLIPERCALRTNHHADGKSHGRIGRHVIIGASMCSPSQSRRCLWTSRRSVPDYEIVVTREVTSTAWRSRWSSTTVRCSSGSASWRRWRIKFASG